MYIAFIFFIANINIQILINGVKLSYISANENGFQILGNEGEGWAYITEANNIVIQKGVGVRGGYPSPTFENILNFVYCIISAVLATFRQQLTIKYYSPKRRWVWDWEGAIPMIPSHV